MIDVLGWILTCTWWSVLTFVTFRSLGEPAGKKSGYVAQRCESTTAAGSVPAAAGPSTAAAAPAATAAEDPGDERAQRLWDQHGPAEAP